MLNKKGKIIVFEDNPDLLLCLESILSDYGYQVMTYNSTQEAKEKITRYQPDLLLLDLKIKPLTGEEVIGLIEESELDQDPAVIVISAKDDLNRIAKKDKVKACLRKPFDFQELITKIEEITQQNTQ